MKNLISHINFLITKHNCVIVPGFGGFVVNRTNADIKDDNTIIAPKISFAFNRDLKYNDGLLAESYMNNSDISYEEACEAINNAVKKMNTALGVNKELSLGRIGELKIEDSGKIIFTSTKDVFFHPLAFGYQNLQIQPLKQIEEVHEIVLENKKKFYLKQLTGAAAAVAAAIFLFFISSTPIDENSANVQKSGFITNVTSPSIENVKPTEPSTIIEEETTVSEENKFFLIIAGENTLKSAMRRLNQIKEAGFSDADCLESPGRVRIYIASFSNLETADNYLQSFKAKYPEYHDAWIFTKN